MRGTVPRAIGACLVALAFAACGSDGDEAASDAAATQVAEGPQEVETGSLEPGHYVAQEFAVPFTFRVRDGWRALAYGPELVTLGRGRATFREGEVPFRIVERVYDAGNGSARKAPSNVATWLRRHPALEVRSVRPDELGGLPGARVRVQARDGAGTARGCDTPCVPIAPPADGEEGRGLAIGVGGTELLLLPLADGRTLAVHVVAHASSFRPQAARLLETVEFQYAS